MSPKIRFNLQKRGWNEAEIRRAEAIVEKEEHQDIFLSKLVFWGALVVIIFANLLISLILIPFLIVFNQGLLYSLVVVLAGTVGFLYNFLVTDIGHLERKHRLWAGIIIPLLALANMVMMVLVSNRFIADLRVQNEPHNPWLIGIVFAVAFIVPYVLSRIKSWVGS